MKRIFSLLLCVCCILFMTACGDSGGASSQGAADSSGTSAPGDSSASSDAAAPSGDGHRYGGTLVIATKLEPSSYVYNYVWDGAIPYLNRNIFSKLVAYDEDTGELYGDLAESWFNSDDLMTFTFNLRQGVKWHDGMPFTSADVKWTIDDLIAKGTEAYGFQKVSMVESVETPDDHTVILHLNKPNGTMINNVADYYGFEILPKHIYEGTDVSENPANTNPIGTGAFKFVEHVIGSHVRLVANPDFYGDGPYLDEVVFSFTPSETTAMTAIEAGESGWMTASPAFAEVARIEGLSGVHVDMQPSTITQWMGFNMDGTRPEINDPKVRLAVCHAISNQEIAEKLYMSLVKPAESFYTTVAGVAWADNTSIRLPAYDVDKANQILDEAGYERGANGYRFELTYRAFATSIFGTTDIPTFVAQHLDAVGIKVNVETYEWAIRTDMLDNRRDWDLCSNGGDRGPDASNFATYLLSTSTGSNKMLYKNERVDELFTLGTQFATREERAPYYFEVQQIISEDLPMYNFVEYGLPRVYSEEYTGFFWQPNSGNSANHMVNTVEWSGGEFKE